MLGLTLLREQVAINKHAQYHSDDSEGCAEVVPKVVVLSCCHANLPPYPIHNILGSMKNHGIDGLVLVIVANSEVVVNKSTRSSLCCCGIFFVFVL